MSFPLEKWSNLVDDEEVQWVSALDNWLSYQSLWSQQNIEIPAKIKISLNEKLYNDGLIESLGT